MILLIITPVRIRGLPRSIRVGHGAKIAYLGKLFNYYLLHLIRTDRLCFCSSVNLGGLFVLEPFISPALFQKYPGSVDEWTLSEMMAADTAGGGLNQLEEHYKTFIVSFFDFINSQSNHSSNRRSKISRRLPVQD